MYTPKPPFPYRALLFLIGFATILCYYCHHVDLEIRKPVSHIPPASSLRYSYKIKFCSVFLRTKKKQPLIIIKYSSFLPL